MSEKYPTRGSHHAHKLTRLLFKSCAAQEMTSDAMLLVIHIAHTEDAARYQGPITFWNSQLEQTLGFKHPRKLNRARESAIDAGWLHYHRDHDRAVGKYWTLIPPHVVKFDDRPIEDSYSENGKGTGDSLSNNGKQTDRLLSTSGKRSGKGSGKGSGKPLNPYPNPNPIGADASNSSKEETKHGTKAPKFDPLSVQVPDSLDRPAFHISWKEWVQDRADRRKPLTKAATARQLNQLEQWGPSKAIQAIDTAIQNSWTGLFEPKTNDVQQDAPAPGIDFQVAARERQARKVTQ